MPSPPCQHGRPPSQCKECGGKGICPHGRQRSKCKDCGGSGICQHNRRRSQCKDCGGSGSKKRKRPPSVNQGNDEALAAVDDETLAAMETVMIPDTVDVEVHATPVGQAVAQNAALAAECLGMLTEWLNGDTGPGCNFLSVENSVT